jgi:urease accessory protein
MYDTACRSEAGTLQRASGELHVSFRRRGDATVLTDLRQVGCLKARFPHVEPAAWTTAVTLNTSGGVASGDRLRAAFEIADGAQATIAAQAAERFYRAVPGSEPADVRTRVIVDNGAAAEWLPQETLLFDRCAVDRRLDVELAADASFLGVEALVFGRTAMGERLEHARLRDLIRIRRCGLLLLRDTIRLDGEVDAVLRRRAIANGAQAVATVVHVAPDAEAHLDDVRAVLPLEGGASAWNGLLLARILAPTGGALRRALIAVLGIIRGLRPLPRVWSC